MQGGVLKATGTEVDRREAQRRTREAGLRAPGAQADRLHGREDAASRPRPAAGERCGWSGEDVTSRPGLRSGSATLGS